MCGTPTFETIMAGLLWLTPEWGWHLPLSLPLAHYTGPRKGCAICGLQACCARTASACVQGKCPLLGKLLSLPPPGELFPLNLVYPWIIAPFMLYCTRSLHVCGFFFFFPILNSLGLSPRDCSWYIGCSQEMFIQWEHRDYSLF